MNTYFSTAETKILKKLNSPTKIQDFLNGLKFNFEEKGETCYSSRMVLKHRKAHCMEGAMFAAAVLEFHGDKPLVMDLRSVDNDFDHVVAVFKQFGCFGAISKTNHAVLRYREPIYKTVRELVLSFFHEYFLDSGKKTLREYSRLLDLRYFDTHPLLASPIPPSLKLRRAGKGVENADSLPLVGRAREGVNWRTSEKDLFEIPEYLDSIRHYPILRKSQIKNLRRADKIEIQAGKLVEYK